MRVVYDRDYRLKDSLEILDKAGIQVEKFDEGKTR